MAQRLPVQKIQSGREGIPAYQALPGLFSVPAYWKRYIDEIQYLDPHLVRPGGGAGGPWRCTPRSC